MDFLYEIVQLDFTIGRLIQTVLEWETFQTINIKRSETAWDRFGFQKHGVQKIFAEQENTLQD